MAMKVKAGLPGSVELAPTFEAYVSERAVALLRYATVVTADPHAAADTVQTVLERAFRCWHRISVLDYPDAYVRRMIVNEAISARRRLAWIVLSERTPEPAAAPDRTDQLDDRDLLIAQIRRLPPRQRAAVGLRYFVDLNDAQIAEQLGCRESTVRGYIWRALKTLRLEFAAAPAVTEVETS